MITDAQVFAEEHLPRRLEHREAEIEHLSRALQPVVDGARAEDVLLSGPSGVGKTVLSRHALERLNERATVASAHVRCVGSTAGVVLRDVIDQLPIAADVHQGTSIDELVATLRNGLDSPAVLILDEADDVPETDLLQHLDHVPDVSMVVICHEPEDWLSRVDEAHRHTLGGEHHLALSRYGTGELADILEHRADLGLHPGAVDRNQLEYTADVAAGVARRGIQTLRWAAQLAGEREHPRIMAEDVDDGYERARKEIRKANLRSLPFHHQLLYSIIRQEGPLLGSELHAFYDIAADDVYRERPQMPVSKKWRRTLLAKLREYDLITQEQAGGDVRYDPVDPDLRSPVDPLAGMTIPE